MKYRALATDYDGTLAHDGIVDSDTLDALARARAAKVQLVLVTGRELPDLFNTFSGVHLFDRVVAENGAVLYDPAQGSVQTLADAPPQPFVEALERASIPLSVGHSIVATVRPHEHVMLDAIRELGLEWHVIFNKDAVMALPVEVTKATGLRLALDALRIAPERTIGIGDAENDHAFLRMCGLAAAVGNALPSLKEDADIVVSQPRGAGVREIILRLLDGRIDDVVPDPRKHHAPGR